MVNRSYTIGDSINITGITGITDSLTSARGEAYTYTASNRLQEGDGIWGTLVWTYDGVGNRTSEALTSGSTTINNYNYPSTSNLLSSLTQSSTTVRSFSYDGACNVTADTRGSTTYNYAYNKRNRLAELTIGSTVTADYTYDGLERLAIRTTSNMTPAGTTQYIYDRAGHLIAEADSAGNTLTEYVWLDDMPLAVVANVDTSPTLYFVHPDHLNRPIRMTDGSESVVWDAVYNPFGDVNSITGSASNNLRFPGQYFLIEDGLHYNWYRHYDPTIGRYIQPDPLELKALLSDGPSIYGYVRQSPLMLADPQGELSWQFFRSIEKLLRACIFAGRFILGDPNLDYPPEPPTLQRPVPRPPAAPPSAPRPEPPPRVPPPPPRLPLRHRRSKLSWAIIPMH